MGKNPIRTGSEAHAPRVAAHDLVLLLTCLAAGGATTLGCGGSSGMTLTKAELMDPTACQSCHPQQFTDWSSSMHAYASEDPVFRAMNQRGQRETNGALGNFCVKCHAPVALAEGLTTDGTNLDTVPASAKGVTCFFCHSAASIDDTHNNPITLASDGSLFGPFADPTGGPPHRSSYSAFFDYARVESASACGSCHDIINKHGAAVERTYSEWQGTLFSDPALGQTCLRCHTTPTEGPASTTTPDKVRSLRSHAFPAVDVALTAFPDVTVQKASVQALLDSVLQGTLCVDTAGSKIELSLDNVGAGHFWPSGATPDRRAWIEVTAYATDAASGTEQVIYQSGNVPVGQTVETVDDPDLWLMRDCLYDDTQAETRMFWDASTLSPPNQIPGSVKATVLDPTTFTRSHVKYVYPVAGALAARPDHVTMKVHLKPIGDDVLTDLVASGDLDPAVAAAVPEYVLGGGAVMDWTAATAKAPTDIQTRMPVSGLACVGTETMQYRTLPSVAVSHARCQFGQP